MATKNRRVAAYLPPEVDKAFIEFKIKNELATEDSPHQNDSQALIQLLSELLGVTHQVEHSVSRQLDIEMAIQLEALKAELVSQISELSSELSVLSQRVDSLKAVQDSADTLTSGQMSLLRDNVVPKDSVDGWLTTKECWNALGSPGSYETFRKLKPDELRRLYNLQAAPEKKVNGKATRWLCMGATSPAQVHPLPEGSERSGEG